MKHQTYYIELPLAPARVQTQLSNKRNVVLYLDKDLVEETRSLGFNLSKTFENHLKQLITQFSQGNQLNNPESSENECSWWAGPDSNRRPSARQAPGLPTETLLTRFREFLKVDLRRSDKTAYEHTYYIKKFLNELAVPIEQATAEDIRKYLKSLSNASSAKYKNILMALKVFFRDFLKAPETVSSFKFPHQVFKPKQILSKEQLQQFYQSLETKKEKALFMLYATTGLRRDEILSLKPENIDFQKRMITPNNHESETKKSWASFYNEEAEIVVREYLATKKPSRSQRLFPMQRDEVVELWKPAREKTGIDITPQKLRQWFCSEMMRLGVSETYVDAFCGRVPKSVLARHYTDFSPKRLEDIYEKANLDCLKSEQQLLAGKEKKER
jgi:integrase/recombinase XerD